MFIALFVLLFAVTGDILQPRWFGAWMSTANVRGIYDLPPNTVDAVALGPSSCVRSFSPLELFLEYGISAYNAGTEQQPIMTSYYLLKEIIKNQSIKVVFLETVGLFRSNDPAFYRKVYDNLKLSKDKIEAVLSYSQYSGADSVFSFITPYIKYHANWKNLTEPQFAPFDADDYPLWHHGFVIDKGQSGKEKTGYTGEEQDRATFIGERLYYLEQIDELCRANNIRLVLYRCVSTDQWSAGMHNATQDWASQHKRELYDFNTQSVMEAAGLKNELDNAGGSHNNVFGAIKTTRYLGKLITDTQAFEDRRKDPTCFYLRAMAAPYAREVRNAKLQVEKDMSEYLVALSYGDNRDNYTVFFTVRDEASSKIGDALKATLVDCGFMTDFADKYRHSFIGVMEGGKVIYERLADDRQEKLAYEGTTRDGTAYAIESAGMEAGDISSVILNSGSNMSKNLRGFNVVVYDNVTHRVIDSVNWDSFAEEGGGNARR
ncbi:MAG: hypothetical protein LBS11_11075 [Oscillospiraceae bacterium]|nr:hypothetical protein [Oscillospiraceae bacterium]